MKSRRLLKGSNQYRNKHRGTWKFYFLGYVLLVLLIMNFALYFKSQGAVMVYAETPIISPLAHSPEPIEPNVLNGSEEKRQIVAYIKEVFGNDADTAFKLLSCENASLNPNAVNTAGNSPAGSRDTGVFQINEYWQKTQYKFLLNWKVNVEIAHQIYKDNGSFDRWTCGRKLGI